ncbi:hypothetical protein C7T94_17415 [Pedobacter yulinensis]|uniref:Uncharacterized protein n=1 Tax=Pedobacter yulinensis TaxID=2126353 RepID=A0A2T3HHP6_9SPHI|nr:hypothetical protein C7T94_17415 [Pedobacter yulinensis]
MPEAFHKFKGYQVKLMLTFAGIFTQNTGYQQFVTDWLTKSGSNSKKTKQSSLQGPYLLELRRM